MGYGGAVDAGAVSTIRPPAASTAPPTDPHAPARSPRWPVGGKIGDRGDRAPWPATPSVRPAYHSGSTELAPEERKECVRDLLPGYLQGAAVPLWPGADGLTARGALSSYPQAAAAGRVAIRTVGRHC